MSPQPVNRGRPSSARRVVFALTAVVLTVVGTVVVLKAPWQAKAAKPRPQGVPIPLAVKPIPAFSQVAREHLMDEKTMDFVLTYLSPEQVSRSGLLTYDKVVGRVLRKDHNPGYAFAEKDLFPIGTRPGLVAGVPPGKVSFVLEADKIMGIRGLRIGDRIDLLASMEINFDKALEGYRGRGMMSPALYDAQSTLTNLPKRAGVKPLVQGGAVVSPATARQVPVPGSPVGPNGKGKSRTMEEVIIAIDPEEVAPLTEALAVHASVFCVAHSGAPEDKIVPTPGSMPSPRVQVIETIVAGKRDILVFPNPQQGPIKVEKPKSETAEKIRPPEGKQEVKPTPSPGGDEGTTVSPGK